MLNVVKGQANGRLSGEGFVFTPQGGAVFPCAAPCADQVYSDQMQWQVTVYGELTGVSFASCGLAPVPSEKFVDGTELNRNSCFSLGTGVRNSQKPTERDLWKLNGSRSSANLRPAQYAAKLHRVSEMISGSSLKTVVLIRKNTGRAFHRQTCLVLFSSLLEA